MVEKKSYTFRFSYNNKVSSNIKNSISVQNTYMPPDITLKIEKVLYSFLWKNRERIKRKILIRKIKNGGINMLDVESLFKSLQCSWITRIVKNSNNLIGNSIIDNFGADKLLLKINNINISYINNIISLFYKQVFKSYKYKVSR